MKTKLSKIVISALTLALLVGPLRVSAAQMPSRSLALGSSGPSAVTTHTFSLTIPGGSNVGSIELKYCDTPYMSCNVPTGLSTTSATLTNQTGATGFSLVNTMQADPYLTRTSTPMPANTASTYTLSNVTNPSVANMQFYVRIYTYASTDATGSPIDDGVIAASTTNQITVQGFMPESLMFCVGTSGTNCGNITGSAVNLGMFTPSAASVGSSVMSASTNASSGYVITLAGTGMASGSNTIPALGQAAADGTSAAPVVGTSGFGTNVRANTTPVIGADVSGVGSGNAYGGYATTNQFRYRSGDKVAAAAGPTKENLFTNSYVVNVSPDQAAGVYAATMTYICTATF